MLPANFDRTNQFLSAAPYLGGIATEPKPTKKPRRKTA